MDYCGSITWWVVLTWMVGLLVIIHHFPLSSPCFTRSLRPQNCYVHDINPHYQTKKCGTRFVSGCQYQTLKFSLLWVWQKFSMWSLSLQVFMPMQDLHVNEVPESRIITIMNINCVFNIYDDHQHIERYKVDNLGK